MLIILIIYILIGMFFVEFEKVLRELCIYVTRLFNLNPAVT